MANSVLTYDELLGRGPFITFNLPLASGQNVVRGEVLAYNTSTNKINTYNAGGSNGTNAFYGIAVEAVNATSGEKRVDVYVGGEFKIGGLVFSDTDDTATQTFINAARDKGCFLKTALSA